MKIEADCSECNGTGVNEDASWYCDNGDKVRCEACYGTGTEEIEVGEE